MQTMRQNKQYFHYALYLGMTDYLVDGLKTGEKVKSYSAPVQMKANISAAKGSAETEQFGINDNYDRVIVTSDMTCPIQEDSILWIGVYPFDRNMQTVPHNYKVYRVARSLNNISIAIKKVSVS